MILLMPGNKEEKHKDKTKTRKFSTATKNSDKMMA